MSAASISHAHISGPLGQALAVVGGETWLFDADGTNSKPSHNDIRFFFDFGLEVQPLPAVRSAAEITEALQRETRLFQALDGVLNGMDRDLIQDTRLQRMRRAARLMDDADIAAFVRARVLRPDTDPAWDVVGAERIARMADLPAVVELYGILASPILARINSEIRVWAANQGYNAVRRTEMVERCFGDGLAVAVARGAWQGDRTTLANLLFGARKAKWDPRLVAHLARAMSPAAAPQPVQNVNDEEIGRDTGPEALARTAIHAAFDASRAAARGNDRLASRVRRQTRSPEEERAAVEREIDWIVARFAMNHPGEAWNGLAKLADRQIGRGGAERLAKSLTNIAMRLRPPMADAALSMTRLAIDGAPNDPTPRNATGEILRGMGLLAEALAAYRDTVRDFPNDAVARCGLAETLREKGLLAEALAAYRDTVRDFPNDAVARNGLAETLRETGLLTEALAAYRDTVRDFPNDVVARNGLAESLRETGLLAEALSAYRDTVRDFPNDVFARNGLAVVLMEAGLIDEARIRLCAIPDLPVTKGDWVGAHISCMVDLKSDRANSVLQRLARYAESCPYRGSRGYFSASLAVARLMARQSGPARETLGSLLDTANPNPRVRATLIYLRAHAEMIEGDMNAARQSVARASNLVPYEEFRLRRLRQELERRIGLASSTEQVQAKQIEEADEALVQAEIGVVASMGLQRGFAFRAAA